MRLTLLLENGTDTVEGAVELVLVLETEIQFAILQRVHHIGYLLDVLPSGSDRSNHRRNNGDDDACAHNMPDGKGHRPYFFSFAYIVGRLTPSIFAATEMFPLLRSMASRTKRSSSCAL